MAMQGLVGTTWLAWLFGVILLKHPWGNPSFPSWFTFSTLYSLIFFSVYVFISLDFLINNFEGLYQDNDHRFGRLVRAFTLIQFTAFSALKRIAFFFNAKKLGRLMEAMHTLEDSIPIEKCERKWLGLTLSLDSGLLALSYAISMSIMFTKGLDFVRTNSDANLWLNNLGVVGFSIVYTVFAIAPFTVVSNSAFAVILVTSQNASKLFCAFCDDVRRSLPVLTNNIPSIEDDSRNKIFQIIHAGNTAPVKKKTFCNKVDPIIQKKLMSFGFVVRQDVIQRFEEVKDLQNLTNRALSSLQLWFISSVTMNLVATGSQLLVIGSGGKLDVMTDIMVLIMNTIFTYTLQVGHRIEERQREAKLRLHREFLNLPWSLEKLEMEDVIQEIVEWDWKMSASGFFTVDRKLASGIFSLVLNYIMIFVQLNIALTEPSANCFNNGTLTTPLPTSTPVPK